MVLFCIPVFLLIIGTELYIRNRPTDFGAKQIQLLNEADSIEVLITGSSHAMNGLIPSQFTLFTFNLAFGSQTLYFDRRITENYLSRLTKLKYVLISFEYTSLYTEHEKNRDFFYSHYYHINYRDRTFYKENLLQSFFVYDLRQTFNLLIDDLSLLKPDQVEDPWVASSDFNYEQAVLSEEKSRKRSDVYQRIINEWQGGDTILNDLEAFIVSLQSKNITPILINFPCSPTLKTFHDEKILKENKRIADYLTKKYSILYLDYWNDDFTYKDYFNPDHLNVHGAEKLTRKVDEVIMRIEMQKHDFKPIN
jgi:hypothetical protein